MEVLSFILLLIIFLWMLSLNSKVNLLNKNTALLESRLKDIEQQQSAPAVKENNKLDESIYCYHESEYEEEQQKLETEQQSAAEALTYESSYDENGFEIEAAEKTEEKAFDEGFSAVYNEGAADSAKISENEPEPAKQNKGFEELILGNIFNITGAIAIIISCIIFIKLASVHIPALKTIAGYLAGFIMIWRAAVIKKESLKKFAEILMGTGFAVLFAVTFAAAALFKVFPPSIGNIIGAVILIGAYYAADRQKTVSMAAIALTGGYLNILSFANQLELPYIFGYILFLNLLSIVFVYRNPGKSAVNFINLVISLCLLFPFLIFRSISIFYPLALWGMYLAYDLIRQEKHNEYIDKANLLNWANTAVLALFSLVIFKSAWINIGCLLFAASGIYALVIFYLKKKGSENYLPYVHSMLTVFLSAVFFALYRYNALCCIAVWSLSGLIMSYVSAKYNKTYLSAWSLAYLTAASAFALLFYALKYYEPLLNERTAAFLLPALIMASSYRMLKKSENKDIKKISEIFNFGFISLLCMYVCFEIRSFESPLSAHHHPKGIIYTIIGLLYSYLIDKIYRLSRIITFDLISKGVYWLCLAGLIIISYLNIFNSVPPLPVINVQALGWAAAIAVTGSFIKNTKKLIYKFNFITLFFLWMFFEIANLAVDNLGCIYIILGLIYAYTVQRLAVKEKSSGLEMISKSVYWLSLAALILTSGNRSGLTPVLNIQTLSWAAAIAVTASFVKNTKELIYKFNFITLIFIWVFFEIRRFSIDDIEFIYMILGLIYAYAVQRLAVKEKSEIIKFLSYFIFWLALIMLVYTGFTSDFAPVLNLRTIAYAAGIITAFKFAELLNTDIYKYAAVFLGFFFITSEIKDYDLNMLSAFWIVYAGAVTLAGIFRNTGYLKKSGMALCSIAALKVFIFDLIGKPMVYKLAAFLTLGVILIVLSYYYNKRKDN